MSYEIQYSEIFQMEKKKHNEMQYLHEPGFPMKQHCTYTCIVQFSNLCLKYTDPNPHKNHKVIGCIHVVEFDYVK